MGVVTVALGPGLSAPSDLDPTREIRAPIRSNTVSSLLAMKSSSLRVLSSRLKTSLSKATPEDFEEYVQDFNEF
ncbi:hypothetical protein U9M48_003951 [Paspalum notatum var. saurae]|uniref:Uncharacterized protein n=1 Tax=Paspalum notatum var. saurae TaxID=547442 RepID=A0AAQ3SL15_PASNO